MASSRQCAHGQGWRNARMISTNATMANETRRPANVSGPRAGLAMRRKRKEAPQSADRPTNWAKWRVLTGALSGVARAT